ncbi:hypothetical protein M422DRAFT_34375, partial [Sphaerobolus stellatus SS14]
MNFSGASKIVKRLVLELRWHFLSTRGLFIDFYLLKKPEIDVILQSRTTLFC